MLSWTEPLDDGVIRISALANYDRWSAMDESSYRLAKLRWYDKMVASAVRRDPNSTVYVAPWQTAFQ